MGRMLEFVSQERDAKAERDTPTSGRLLAECECECGCITLFALSAAVTVALAVHVVVLVIVATTWQTKTEGGAR